MQQYETYKTAINHPALNILRLDCAIRNVYKHTLIVAEGKGQTFDTTKPLQQITVNPTCLDTLLGMLTKDSTVTQDDEEILYLQTTKYFSSDIERKTECYARTYHTANHGIVVEE